MFSNSAVHDAATRYMRLLVTSTFASNQMLCKTILDFKF